MNILTKCFKHTPDSCAKYIQLEEINYKEEKFNILQYSFYSDNRKIVYKKIPNITITDHSILFHNIEIYFEYLLRFFEIDARSVGIKCIGTIDIDNKIFKLKDEYMLTLIIFPCLDIKKKFMDKLFEQIKLYKIKNIYNKNILEFKTFKTN